MRKLENDDTTNSNTIGYDKQLFFYQLEKAIHLSKVDFEKLAEKITILGYPITGPNLRTYITHRNLSFKVLFYLSKAINVSMDYLVGNSVGFNDSNENFDHEIWRGRYYQYPGDY